MGRDRNRKDYARGGLGTSISYKMMFFHPPVSKTVGGNTFLVAKSVIFKGGGETLQNIINCNYVSNINVSNNKTADM